MLKLDWVAVLIAVPSWTGVQYTKSTCTAKLWLFWFVLCGALMAGENEEDSVT